MHIHTGCLPPLCQTLWLRRTKGHHHCLEQTLEWETHAECVIMSTRQILVRTEREKAKQGEAGTDHTYFCISPLCLTCVAFWVHIFQLQVKRLTHNLATGQRFGNLSPQEFLRFCQWVALNINQIPLHLTVVWLACTIFHNSPSLAMKKLINVGVLVEKWSRTRAK